MKSFMLARRIVKSLTGIASRRQCTVLASAVLLLGIAPVKALDSIGEWADDASITTDVKQSLLFHLLLNTRIETHEGVVTLSGHAGNVAEKDLNTRLAAEIVGVKSVLNQMITPVAVDKTIGQETSKTLSVAALQQW